MLSPLLHIISLGAPLGTGRLIVVCVPIQKRRQVDLGEILFGWERGFLIDVEAGP
jgi:hypothetical protein